MSQPEPRPLPEPTCCECGATNDPGASECWLCQRRNWFSDPSSGKKETAASWGGDPARVPVAAVIIIGALAILGAGMGLQASGTYYDLLCLLPVPIPVVLYIWSRFRKRPLPGQPMTTLEFVTALTTIAVGGVLIVWMVSAGGALQLLVVSPFFLIPASLITWAVARNRRLKGRPMAGLERISSVIFLAVVLPALVIASLFIAGMLICLAARPSH